MHHELKLHPDYFEVKRQGLKPWELRETADRHFEVDDTVTFREWHPDQGGYTGQELGPFKILYVMDRPIARSCVFTHGSQVVPVMVPNPVKGLQVEMPQLPGFALELGPGRRAVATMTQEFLRVHEAALVQAIKNHGAREAQERIMKNLLADAFRVNVVYNWDDFGNIEEVLREELGCPS